MEWSTEQQCKIADTRIITRTQGIRLTTRVQLTRKHNSRSQCNWRRTIGKHKKCRMKAVAQIQYLLNQSRLISGEQT